MFSSSPSSSLSSSSSISSSSSSSSSSSGLEKVFQPWGWSLNQPKLLKVPNEPTQGCQLIITDIIIISIIHSCIIIIFGQHTITIFIANAPIFFTDLSNNRLIPFSRNLQNVGLESLKCEAENWDIERRQLCVKRRELNTLD